MSRLKSDQGQLFYEFHLGASQQVRSWWRGVLKKLAEGSLDHELHAKQSSC